MKKSSIIVKMYDEEIEIDKSSGLGFDKVLKKIEPLILSLASKFKIDNYTKNDTAQELYLIAIEGIRSYDHNKSVKLSTFLHVHIHNKIISKLKSSLKKSNNASYLHNAGDFSREIATDLDFLNEPAGECLPTFLRDCFVNSDSDFNIFLGRLQDHVDYDTWLIVKYLSIDGLSIKEISEKMNINSWTVSSRLKKLCKNEFIVSFYEK